MKIPATITTTGAYIPVLIYSKELTTRKPILFLVDTGAYVSAISAIDISNYIDFNNLNKSSKLIYGIGGSQTSYLIHDIIFYFLTDSDIWIESKRFKELSIVPYIYNLQLFQKLKIPSVIGIDIIGKEFSFYYGKNQAFLELIK